MGESKKQIRLRWEQDRVIMTGGDGDEGTPVKLVWARPITGRGGAISVLDAKKNELAMLESLDALDPDSRKVAEEELTKRYIVPHITRVIRTKANFGIRYWHVETDRGERRFALKNASKNAFWVSRDRLMLRDTLGCLYEISHFSALDPRSRSEVEKVI